MCDRGRQSRSLYFPTLIFAICFFAEPWIAPHSAFGESNSSASANRPQNQTSLPPLHLGESVTQQIGGGQTQNFTITVAAGQFAEIAVEQHGSILLVTLFDPQNKEVIKMDFPGGGYGPIKLSLISELAGDYRLEVRSVDKWARIKDYDVAVTALRTAAANDRLIFENELTFAEAGKKLTAGNAAAAIEPYNQALAYWQTSQNRHWEAVTQYATSQAYRISGNRQKSEGCLNETLRILALEMAPNDWRLKASSLNDLGPIYTATGRVDQAIAVLNQALELYSAHDDNRGRASALNNLAGMHSRRGELTEAGELVEKALAFRNMENDRPGAINLLNGLGAISDKLGEPERALDYFTQALNGWQALDEITPGDRRRVAQVFNNLATENDKLGRFDQALKYYDQALEIYQKGSPDRAATLDNQGELYVSLGNPQKGRECYKEALDLLTVPKPDLDVKAGLLVHMGQLSLIDGNVKLALSQFSEARDLQPGPAKLADVLTNLGAAFALDGDLEKAMEAYQSAYEIQLRLKNQRGQGLTLQKRGEAHALRGEKVQALDDFNRALAAWKAVKDVRGEAATLENIARVERDRGNFAAAKAKSDEAIQIVENLRTDISSRQLRTSYFATRENYFELDIDLKMQDSKTREGIAAALESSEKARARGLLDSLSEARIGRVETLQTTDTQLAALLKQRQTLSDNLGAKAWARTNLLTGAYSTRQLALIEKEIDEISVRYDQVEVAIRERTPQLNSLLKPKPALLKQIQQQLDHDTVLLEYSLGEERSYVWVVTTNSIDGFPLPPRDHIESAARTFAKSLADRKRTVAGETAPQYERRRHQADEDFNTASAELSDKIIRPVAPLLGTKRLVVVADGALQVVSFAALPLPGATAQNQRRLIDNHEIVYEPSASVLALQRSELADRKRAAHAVIILANPVFTSDDSRVAALTERNPSSNSQPKSNNNMVTRKGDVSRALEDIGLERFPRLFSSAVEAQKITAVAPKSESKAILDFDANRETAMSSELAQYRIVHFATHAVVNYKHPELSGMVFSLVDRRGQPRDGYLRLHDIYNLNLPADLVVLSACQTGIGKEIKGEGLITLTRGFMYAGAERVVASLWKVDDAATAELMAELYIQIFANGQRPAAALRTAQLKLAKKRSPADWAGFVLQGEWK